MTRHQTATSVDKLPGEAASWYVRHESDEELTPAEWQEWEQWSADPANCAEYDELVRLHRRMQSVHRPTLPSDSDVQADTVVPPGGSVPQSRRSLRGWPLSAVAAAAAAACLAIVVTVPLTFFRGHQAHVTVAGAVPAVDVLPFSESALETLRASGRPVLVNLGADWCTACKVNDQTLASDAVQEMMARKRVAYVKGDWTEQNQAVSAVLKQFGRPGLPVYLLYCPGAKDPKVLPQLLSKDIVVSALSQLPDPGGPQNPG